MTRRPVLTQAALGCGEMRIYLAARYGRMAEMCAAAEVLRAAGHDVTARWIDGMEEGETPQRGAEMDIEDVRAADLVLSFTEPKNSTNKGGGRHFEMGLAWAAGKRLAIVGDREIVFHHLPGIEHFDDLAGFVSWLAESPHQENTP